MRALSYQEDQIAIALARFSPRQQLLFGIALCKRLLSLYTIHSNPEVLSRCMETLEQLVHSGEAPKPALLALQETLNAPSIGTTEPWTRECVHAFQLLVDAADSGEQRLGTILEILTSSREIVELVAWENMGLAAWDKHADEKVRTHPLVQSELEELYADLKTIWDIKD